jgi:ABC-type nitrate/sulfonate/bicarbonate transport system substrate-binding protein
MRAWARENANTVTRYLAAHVEEIRWMLSPANTDVTFNIIAERKRLDAAMAQRNLALLTGPR